MKAKRDKGQDKVKSIVAAITWIGNITKADAVDSSTTSGRWVVGGLTIELDWSGPTVKIDTEWPADHELTPDEQRIYDEIALRCRKQPPAGRRSALTGGALPSLGD